MLLALRSQQHWSTSRQDLRHFGLIFLDHASSCQTSRATVLTTGRPRSFQVSLMIARLTKHWSPNFPRILSRSVGRLSARATGFNPQRRSSTLSNTLKSWVHISNLLQNTKYVAPDAWISLQIHPKDVQFVCSQSDRIQNEFKIQYPSAYRCLVFVNSWIQGKIHSQTRVFPHMSRSFNLEFGGA